MNHDGAAPAAPDPADPAAVQATTQFSIENTTPAAPVLLQAPAFDNYGEAPVTTEHAAALPQLVWQGGLFVHHSLSLINRELCLQLLQQGFRIAFQPCQPDEFDAAADPRFPLLEALRGNVPEQVDITVRHQWPPDFSRPEQGRLVVIQPWEYGSVPAAWVAPINSAVDELWVPSSYVRDCYLEGGVFPGKVQVIPNGVNTERFYPAAAPCPLRTAKGYRFLFVGGTIHRKGIDLLLAAYAAEFSAADDVCLVIKEMGRAGIYSGQTAQATIEAFRTNPDHPELLYLEEMLDDAAMAGLYTACDCLVHPYRGEGFGMPIAEAMACAVPVIVTGRGAALDFCTSANAYLIPAERRELATGLIGGLETVAAPWFAEPDLAELQRLMRHVFSHRDEASARGELGRSTILAGFSWQRVGRMAAERLCALMSTRSASGAAEPLESAGGGEDQLRKRLALQSIAAARRLALRLEIDQACEELIQKGIAVAPELAEPYRALLEILVGAKRHADAFEVLREVPASMAVAETLTWRALCFTAMGNDEAARQAAESALIMVPANGRALAVLGTLAQRGGDTALAERYFRGALDADAGCADAALALGVLRWGAGAQEEAYGLLRTAVRCNPLDSDALALYRSAASTLGHCGEEADLLAELSRCHPESRLIMTHLVDALAATGRGDEAMAELERALGQFGADDDLLDTALELRGQLGERSMSSSPYGGLSLCMIVKNEASNLPGCLASVARLVDELVIVDTGSSDRTIDIATAFGARIYGFDWTGRFADARNFALSKAQGRWILVMDADEKLSSLDHAAVRRLLAASDPAREAWNVPIRNYSTRSNVQGWTANDGRYPQEEAADGWYPAERVRIFPNDPRISYEGVVHELVEPSLRRAGFSIRTAPLAAHHYGELYGTPEELLKKQQRYFELGKQKLAERPDDLAAMVELAVQAAELGQYPEALELWERVLALRPDTVEALFSKGHVLMQLKRYDEALAVSRRALECDPCHREAAFNYGTCELYVGEPQRALPIVERLLQQNERHPQLLALKTIILLAMNKIDQAFKSFSWLTQNNYSIEEYIKDRISNLRLLGRNDLADNIAKAIITEGH